MLPEQLRDKVILVGDPGRVDLVASFFDTRDFEVSSREFHTVGGTYKGKSIMCLSHGIGTDNIDIVVNELDALANIDFATRYEKPQFRQLQEANFMQSLLLWLFGTIPEKVSAGKSYSRKQMVCYRFMQLVREYGTREHRVEFYADRLCITPRYLHRAMVEHWGGKSPKLLIDEQLVAEVKVLLADPALSVTEIAQRLNFVDQSYLSRFFKKYTGLSPKEYRAQGFVFF